MPPDVAPTSKRIGIAAAVLAVAAMAVDHAIPRDWPAFVISLAVALGIVAVVFGLVVPRALRADDAPRRAAASGLVLSAVGVLGLPLLFVGVPFGPAAGGLALGLSGRSGPRARLAWAAIVVGGAVLALATAAYTYEAITDPT